MAVAIKMLHRLDAMAEIAKSSSHGGAMATMNHNNKQLKVPTVVEKMEMEDQ